MRGPFDRRAFLKASLAALVPGELNIHQKAYAFWLANPNLSAATSNMVNEQQMLENLVVAGG